MNSVPDPEGAVFNPCKPCDELGDGRIGQAEYVRQDGVVFRWSGDDVRYLPVSPGEIDGVAGHANAPRR